MHIILITSYHRQQRRATVTNDKKAQEQNSKLSVCVLPAQYFVCTDEQQQQTTRKLKSKTLNFQFAFYQRNISFSLKNNSNNKKAQEQNPELS